jgi:hypothetical protein
LLRKIERLRDNGTFVNPWVKHPFLWLLNHVDTLGKGYGDYDYEAINRSRFARLPEWVQTMMGNFD